MLKKTCVRDMIPSAYKSKSGPKRLRHLFCDICDVGYGCNNTDCQILCIRFINANCKYVLWIPLHALFTMLMTYFTTIY